MALKKYHGSCSCGKVRFEVSLDLSQGTGRCNCTVCRKRRFWGAQVKPEAFKLLSGEGDLTDYGFSGEYGETHHLFCKHCGVHSFGKGDLPQVMGKYVAVNLGALDDVTDEELAAAPIRYMDGLNDNWFQPPKVTAHL